MPDTHQSHLLDVTMAFTTVLDDGPETQSRGDVRPASAKCRTRRGLGRTAQLAGASGRVAFSR